MPMTDDTVVLAWTSDGHPDSAWCASKDGLRDYDHQGASRIINQYDMNSGPLISSARNKLIAHWLSEPKPAKWMLMMDTDGVFERDALERLLATALGTDAGVCGGLAFMLGPPPKPTIFVLDEDKKPVHVFDYPRDGPIECDATGCHFLLIRLDVAQALWNRATLDGHAKAKDPDIWFAHGRTPAGESFGEDVAFCLRARRAGFKVVIDPRIEIGHIKPVIVDEKMYDLFREFIGEKLGHPLSSGANNFYESQAAKRGLDAPLTKMVKV